MFVMAQFAVMTLALVVFSVYSFRTEQTTVATAQRSMTMLGALLLFVLGLTGAVAALIGQAFAWVAYGAVAGAVLILFAFYLPKWHRMAMARVEARKMR